jgi:hypothetical protein
MRPLAQTPMFSKERRVEMMQTLNELRQHELVILRRLRGHPLTEFELATEVAEHSGFTADDAADRMETWLESLQEAGYLWFGRLYNDKGQFIRAAALTKAGRDLVG